MIMKRFGSALVLCVAVLTAVASTAQQPAPAAAYSWADSCKNCHRPIYDAWAKTKHAGAWDRLGASDKEGACIGCHLTGPKERVMDGGKVLNRGVQCESCHGAAGAHAADPAVRSGLTKVPPSSVCEDCHSSKSPRFKGFFYSGMVAFSHKVQ